MSQQIGRNGLNALVHVFLQGEESVQSTMTVMDLNMKKKNVKMLMIYVFSHFLMNFQTVSYQYFHIRVNFPTVSPRTFERDHRFFHV